MKREDVPAAIRKLADRAAKGRDPDPDLKDLSDLTLEAEAEARRIRATTADPTPLAFAADLMAAVEYARRIVWPKKPPPPDQVA